MVEVSKQLHLLIKEHTELELELSRSSKSDMV